MENLKTYKIWDKKNECYVTNTTGYGKRAPYDCFPRNSVKQIAGRLLGTGNYEVHEFDLVNKAILD